MDSMELEKERGITIDLGFAYWKDTITIIDVPGHDKFIRNMAAGVNMVDLFILVIAADDGIMPQTREHLEILKFFNVQRGIVVLNKIDLVEEDWLELVQDEVRSFLQNSGFKNVPLIPVSSINGSGIDELRQTIFSSIESLPAKTSTRTFRLNIDRSFSAKGFGAVVTGTVLSSELVLESRLQVLPEKIETRYAGWRSIKRKRRILLPGSGRQLIYPVLISSNYIGDRYWLNRDRWNPVENSLPLLKQPLYLSLKSNDWPKYGCIWALPKLKGK